eukprot:CAMPEP_0178406136 /NCGR_PEP_ID=MMETSP0689_2-20121128/18757_1 /TAXON_ID=160604 /ORGANISM="Amphidinium massartii, Strain CS-259" /LENGTH=182 /DNA_ID=CAMNT_0020027169 /DNA_START=108 /DNA_END=656 /DNA_ORIENTATION=+
MGASNSNLPEQVGQNARGPKVLVREQAASLTEQNVKALSSSAGPVGGLRRDEDADSEGGLSDWQFQPTVHYPKAGTQPSSTLPTLTPISQVSEASGASGAQRDGLVEMTSSMPSSEALPDPLGGPGDNLTKPDVPRLNLGRNNRGGADAVQRPHQNDVGGHCHNRKDRGCDLGPVSDNCPQM